MVKKNLSRSNRHHCEPCGMVLRGASALLQHVLSEKHNKMTMSANKGKSSKKQRNQRSIAEIIKTRTMSAVVQTHLRCHHCQKVLQNAASYKQHIQSAKHQKKLLLAQEIEASTEAFLQGTSPYPVISDCKTDSIIPSANKRLVPRTVEDTPWPLRQSPSPYQLYAALAGKTTPVIAEPMDAGTPELLCPIPTYPHESCVGSIREQRAANKFQFYCGFCQRMMNSVACYSQHVESQRHKNKLTKTRVGESTTLGLTPATSPYPFLLQHIGTMQSSAGEGFRCDPCGKTFSGDKPYAQHVVSEKHRKKLLSLGIYPTSPANLRQVAEAQKQPSIAGNCGPVVPYCVACKASFTTNLEAVAHFSSPAHTQKSPSHSISPAATTSSARPAASSTSSNNEADLVKRILEHHQRTFLLCDVHESFAEFVQKHKLFEQQA